MGFLGPTFESSSRELMVLLEAEHAQLACFEETLLEIRGVLNAAAAALHNPDGFDGAPFSVVSYFREKGYGSSDMYLMLGCLDKTLAGLHVQAQPFPPHTAGSHVDESSLAQVLQKTVNYQHESTLAHDRDALAAIFRLRAGRFPSQFDTCTALFVTTNSGVVRAGTRYFEERNRDAEN